MGAADRLTAAAAGTVIAGQPFAPRRNSTRPARIGSRPSAAHLISLSCRHRPSGHNQTRPGRTRHTRRKARPAQGGVVLEVLDHTLHEPHRATAPAVGAMVRKINAHSHHKHLTTEITMTFALVTTVELRGLEPLTL